MKLEFGYSRDSDYETEVCRNSSTCDPKKKLDKRRERENRPYVAGLNARTLSIELTLLRKCKYLHFLSNVL